MWMTSGLQALVEVARRGSIAAAARQLNYSPSTVGRHLRQLEHDVGTTLVAKGWQGSTLTPDAELLVPRACALLCGAEQMSWGNDPSPSPGGSGCVAGERLPCVGFGPCAGSAGASGPGADADRRDLRPTHTPGPAAYRGS